VLNLYVFNGCNANGVHSFGMTAKRVFRSGRATYHLHQRYLFNVDYLVRSYSVNEKFKASTLPAKNIKAGGRF